jgi:hypothetical protein
MRKTSTQLARRRIAPSNRPGGVARTVFSYLNYAALLSAKQQKSSEIFPPLLPEKMLQAQLPQARARFLTARSVSRHQFFVNRRRRFPFLLLFQ